MMLRNRPSRAGRKSILSPLCSLSQARKELVRCSRSPHVFLTLRQGLVIEFCNRCRCEFDSALYVMLIACRAS